MPVHVTVLKERSVLVLAPTRRDKFPLTRTFLLVKAVSLFLTLRSMPFPDLRFIPRDRRELQRRIPGRLVQVTSRGRERGHESLLSISGARQSSNGCFPLCVRIHVGKSFPHNEASSSLDLVTKPRKSFGAFLGSVL